MKRIIRLTRPDAGCVVALQGSTILHDPTMPVKRSTAFLEVFAYTIRFCSTENNDGAARTGLAYTPRFTKDVAALIFLVLIEIKKRRIQKNINLLFLRRGHIAKDRVVVNNKIVGSEVGSL